MKEIRSKTALYVGGIFLLSLACASVSDLMKAGVQKPTVAFAGVRLDNLSFSAVDLLFDLKITNPNPVGATLAGFDYDFLLNGNSFLQGNQEQNVKIPAQGEQTLPVPVTLNFDNIYDTFKSLRDQDSTGYSLNCGLSFDLPILGPQRIPISKTGSVPLIKIPKIAIASLKLNKLNLSGADLKLQVKLTNPNALAFTLQAFDYRLEINGQPWLDSRQTQPLEIAAKKPSVLEIPFSVNFLQIGQSAYTLLSGKQDLSYRLKGGLHLTSSLPIFKETKLPFDTSGKVPLSR
jgi:LEA14-like dessication related protein